jgi:hypothetical protein
MQEAVVAGLAATRPVGLEYVDRFTAGNEILPAVLDEASRAPLDRSRDSFVLRKT